VASTNKSIMKYNCDIRQDLYSNIVLSGGTTTAYLDIAGIDSKWAKMQEKRLKRKQMKRKRQKEIQVQHEAERVLEETVTENFLSGRLMVLIFMVTVARAVISFCMGS
jgi:hypothetical protein